MAEDRIMIFIDGQNLMHGASNFGVHVDSVKLVEVLSEGRKLKRAYYYGSIPANPNDDEILKEQISRQMSYYHSLEYAGFKTSIIPLRKRTFSFECEQCGHTTSIERSIEKGVDIALVSDLLSLAAAGAYDVATIVSGDLDYHKAIDEVQRRGLIVEVAYFRSQGISKELIRLADRFIDLEKIIERIKRDR
jgi:uncharacterized LabA/DUF88 family protein